MKKETTMQRWLFFFTVIMGLLISGSAIGFDATGIWDYNEHSHTNNCGEEDVPRSGEMGILQTGDTFLITGEDFSTYGTVSGATYTYTDTFCEDNGTVNGTAVITLSSATNGTGTVNWTWSGPGGSCGGSHQLTVTKKISPSNPNHNATGKWNFTQSNSWNTCDPSSTPPRYL
jgi:hypothetical protein